jgi:hypothetical protein
MILSSSDSWLSDVSASHVFVLDPRERIPAVMGKEGQVCSHNLHGRRSTHGNHGMRATEAGLRCQRSDRQYHHLRGIGVRGVLGGLGPLRLLRGLTRVDARRGTRVLLQGTASAAVLAPGIGRRMRNVVRWTNDPLTALVALMSEGFSLGGKLPKLSCGRVSIGIVLVFVMVLVTVLDIAVSVAVAVAVGIVFARDREPRARWGTA